jgi:hypothetical protein
MVGPGSAALCNNSELQYSINLELSRRETMNFSNRLAPYFLIATLSSSLAGCPYGGRHDDSGGNRGQVDQQQSPTRDHRNDDRNNNRNQGSNSDRDHHDADASPDHQ